MQVAGGLRVYRARVKSTSTTILLEELRTGLVVPERYSRRSLCGRHEQLAATTAAACAAVLGSIVLREMTKPR